MTSSASPSNPDTANRFERALGITDRRGWLLGWWQSLVVGSAFVIISLIGYHSPQPRDVPLAITGTTEVQQVEAQVAAAAGGGYRFSRFDSAGAADAALHRGDVYAVVDLTGTPTIRYAGAQGPTVFAAFAHTLVPSVAAATRTSPDIVDALPLADNDAAALPLFYLCFAVVLASYLFAITTTTQARRLGAWGHWTSAAALAASLGLVGALVARFGTGTIAAHTPTVAFVLTLTSLATGATSYLLLRLSSTFGSILGTVILIIAGSASGGVVPGQFLPSWLAALRPVLPMGVALTTIRDVTYFGGQHILRGVLVLALWALLPLPVATLVNRRRQARTASLVEAADPAAAAP
jgi:hypothetical protein